MLIQSVLLTGASGVGKSTLMRGALEYYKSGAVVLAPGTDERDSYLGLESDNYTYGAFDDVLFQPSLVPPIWNADGHQEMVKWLRELYLTLKSDVDSGKSPRYSVLAVDTLSAVGRLAFNATLSRFKLTEPPAAIGSSGAPFYSYLRMVLESGVRLMRAIRGLGVHLIVASHPTEAEATQIQQTQAAPNPSKIMPDLPGGFKNMLPSYFTTVLDVNIGPKGHFVRWAGDPRRVTKSRLGSLSPTGIIELPKTALGAWTAVNTAVEAAMQKLVDNRS